MSQQLISGRSLNGYIKMAETPFIYRKEKDGSMTPLTQKQYESEAANLYAKGSAYRDRVEQLIKGVNH